MNALESAVEHKMSLNSQFFHAVRAITNFSCSLIDFLSDFLVDAQNFQNISEFEAVVKKMSQKSYFEMSIRF